MKVRTRSFIPKGQVFIVADFEHPEVPMTNFSLENGEIKAEPAETPEGRIIVCHPDDEQMVRDAIAVAQERGAEL